MPDSGRVLGQTVRRRRSTINWNNSPQPRVDITTVGSCELLLFTFGEIVESVFEQLCGKLHYLTIHWITRTFGKSFGKSVDPACACPTHKNTGKKTPAGVSGRGPGPDVGRWGDIKDAPMFLD